MYGEGVDEQQRKHTSVDEEEPTMKVSSHGSFVLDITFGCSIEVPI